MTNPTMTLEQFCAAVNELAVKDSGCPPCEECRDPEYWRMFHEMGWTPEEAWAEEKSYVAMDLG